MLYLVKTPWWLKKIYPGCVWQMPPANKTIYLSFDDGPHPEITPFVLAELKKYHAEATFFCIGKNVINHPAAYQQILAEGHSVGNHSHNHLNGWKTADEIYLGDVNLAKEYIHSNLFRPPYGRATKVQLKMLAMPPYELTPIMWTVLSGDFDAKLTKEKCLDNVLQSTKDGSIVLFHDSEKAFDKMKYALPKLLEHFSAKGYSFKKINV